MSFKVQVTITLFLTSFLFSCGMKDESNLSAEVPISQRVTPFYQGYAECVDTVSTLSLPNKTLGKILQNCKEGDLVYVIETAVASEGFPASATTYANSGFGIDRRMFERNVATPATRDCARRE